ncbi:polysaccharide deacetylase family protein [Undibacterium sp. TJN25]|uniref:polysaccharide deacetylase family protein n=1 Tax=Undibacterium sp. TJN25 TaxID=3413056 RepID=UPI003BF15682
MGHDSIDVQVAHIALVGYLKIKVLPMANNTYSLSFPSSKDKAFTFKYRQNDTLFSSAPVPSLFIQVKTVVKEMIYALGGMGVYHRFRNRQNLTVVMFHRVLPRSDIRAAGADPEWTMSTDTFRACLKFFKKHYCPISMEQLATAHVMKKELPACSLLITFDDGWADTSEYAQPILDELGLSALVFVAGSIINQTRPFWQESLYHLLSSQPDGLAKLQTLLAEHQVSISHDLKCAKDEEGIRTVIRQLGNCDHSRLNAIAQSLQLESDLPPSMLTTEQLKNLTVARHSVGSHGMSHQPLTTVKNPQQEVSEAKEILTEQLGSNASVNTMSFPHGAYNKDVANICWASGYEYLFSSDSLLNRMQNSNKKNRIWGRIHISERAITDMRGNFHPSMLATWLFSRPSGTLLTK